MPSDNLLHHEDNGATLVVESGGTVRVLSGAKLDAQPGSVPVGIALCTRQRFTTAQVNAGASILPAVAGYKYRLIDVAVIAIGGNASGLTTCDILATQAAGSVKLLAAAQAQLTQSALVFAGGTGGAILADGASFVQNDVNTAITIGKTGGSLATATAIDVILNYVLEA